MNNGYIFVYVLIIAVILLGILSISLTLKNSYNERRSEELELLKYKFEVEAYTCFIACERNIVDYVDQGYIEFDQYYRYKIEKADECYIIYGIYTLKPDLVYFQKFNNYYTVPQSNRYVIYEEGYLE